MHDDNWNLEPNKTWFWYTPAELFNRYPEKDIRTEKSIATIDELKASGRRQSSVEHSDPLESQEAVSDPAR